jgi:hypothetical protein
MLEGDLAYSVINLAVGFVSIALGIFVFMRNPYLKLSKLFLVVTFFYLLVSLAGFLMVNALDSGAGLIWAKVYSVSVIGALSTQFLLITMLPFERNPGQRFKRRDTYIGSSVALAVLIALTIDRVEPSVFGWTVEPGLGTGLLLAIMAWFGTVSVSPLIEIHEHSDADVKHLTLLLAAGVSFPLIFGLADMLVKMAGGMLPQLMPIGFLVCGTVFMYAVVSNDLFQFKPRAHMVLKAMLPAQEEEPEKHGTCYLIESKKSDHAYMMLLRSMNDNGKGLVITRIHPDRIKEDFGLVKVPIIWLATQPGPDRVDPASLSILQHTIVDALQKEGATIVLLDGLEYLISENQSDKVLRMMYAVRDAVTVCGAMLLVPLDPEVLSTRDLALLEREFDIIRTESGAGSEI